jgi:hypothetical protein
MTLTFGLGHKRLRSTAFTNSPPYVRSVLFPSYDIRSPSSTTIWGRRKHAQVEQSSGTGGPSSARSRPAQLGAACPRPLRDYEYVARPPNNTSGESYSPRDSVPHTRVPHIYFHHTYSSMALLLASVQSSYSRFTSHGLLSLVLKYRTHSYFISDWGCFQSAKVY